MSTSRDDRADNGDPKRRPGESRARSAAGFTLVEMLIALVVTGIMAGGVITLLMGQNRFYGSTDDAVFAEQSLRATSDLVASEVRMINPATDIATADAGQLTFWMDAHRGVVCEVNASNDVFAYMLPAPSATNLESGIEGYFFRQAYSGSAWTGPELWNPLTSYEQAGSATHSIATTCDGGGGPTPTSSNYRSFWKFPAWSGPTTPPDGAYLRISGKVTYSFGPSSFGSGTAVFRNGQELAGPFQSDAAFSYVMESGAVENSTTNFAQVRRIRVNATAVGAGNNRYGVSRDLQFDIPVRNQ